MEKGQMVCDPNPVCQGTAGQLRWALRRSPEGTELGPGARPWSRGDRARYGDSRGGSCSGDGAEGDTGSPGGDRDPEGRAGLWSDRGWG